MCRVLNVHQSGFYAWLKNPLSVRGARDQRQCKYLNEAWEAERLERHWFE